MFALEQSKADLLLHIKKEEIAHPILTKDKVVFWFHRMRKFDAKKLEHRRRLIDTFVNAIFLYDDKLVITFNYKEGTKTITFAELEESALRSDLTCQGEPNSTSFERKMSNFFL